MRYALPCLFALASAGCVSLSPEAQRVALVHDGGAVNGCTLLGTLRVDVARVGLAQVDDVMRNDAAALGADTALLLSRAFGEGAAYRCAR